MARNSEPNFANDGVIATPRARVNSAASSAYNTLTAALNALTSGKTLVLPASKCRCARVGHRGVIRTDFRRSVELSQRHRDVPFLDGSTGRCRPIILGGEAPDVAQVRPLLLLRGRPRARKPT